MHLDGEKQSPSVHRLVRISHLILLLEDATSFASIWVIQKLITT